MYNICLSTSKLSIGSMFVLSSDLHMGYSVSPFKPNNALQALDLESF